MHVFDIYHIFRVLCQVVHIFSHIHQTYIVFSVRVSDWSDGEREQKTCWLSKSALHEAAVSTGVKKVCAFCFGCHSKAKLARGVIVK